MSLAPRPATSTGVTELWFHPAFLCFILFASRQLPPETVGGEGTRQAAGRDFLGAGPRRQHRRPFLTPVVQGGVWEAMGCLRHFSQKKCSSSMAESTSKRLEFRVLLFSFVGGGGGAAGWRLPCRSTCVGFARGAGAVWENSDGACHTFW